MSGATAKQSHIWNRDEFDFYIEPEIATDALLTAERFLGAIHDPCCGQGNIVRAAIRAGYRATGSDIIDRVDASDYPTWMMGVSDFLLDDTKSDNIIMNPPFFRAKGTEAFIRKGLDVVRGKMAVFTDIKFLAGAQRANGLFDEHPPNRVWIITPRVSCPPGEYLMAGNTAGGGTADWIWMVYDRTIPFTGTQIGWLRKKASA